MFSQKTPLTDESRETPYLALDLDVFDANMTELVDIARRSGVELMPHAKTHKISALGVRQIELGAAGLTVATIAEAESFHEAGIVRIFVANPLAGAEKIDRAIELARVADMSFAADTGSGVEAISRAFSDAGCVARIMIAVDSGLGREGVAPAGALELAQNIATLPGVELEGIYTHEGSVYAAEDPAQLEQHSREVAQLMASVAESIGGRGIEVPQVSMGASASARHCAQIPGVTEIRPGIAAFNDLGQIALGNATLETVAVRVVATVTSSPEPGRGCIDAGSKSLSADLLPASAFRDTYPGHGLIVNAPGWIIDKVSEEHGWLRWNGAGPPTRLPVGTRLEIVPNHVCMALASLRRAYTYSGGAFAGVLETF